MYSTNETGGRRTPLANRIARALNRSIDRAVAVQESLMLHDVVEMGTGMRARIGRWAAGKTGTTQSYRDAWFVDWSGDISPAVWLGRRDGQVAMTHVRDIKVTGGSFPASIWAEFMKGARDARSAAGTAVGKQESGGQGQVLVRVCEDSLQLPNSRCPRTIDIYFEPGLSPTKICSIH